MFSTVDFFDLVMQKHELESDYALAGRLDVTRALVCMHRKKQMAMGENLAVRVAELLDMDLGFVLACSAAQNAKGFEAKKAFSRLAGLASVYPEKQKTALKGVAP